ncbi:hypothetical protein CABS01_13480 [Colletotrichum abscissum]|uniref:NAD(P)-binding domain-containing protein n=1 Tax=Colletotrichum abscissum TaxID=1671311 RepID=A0A9P9XF91_9PEZI|nr:uncharacterized protein CABS01_13480 [Colletotrichum abscissum]KAI3550422.1 hypothetical protein CABS02_07643 [Colletotrichum abscissum]KAK1485786.1 hypothetical protein CABS01_13480 [Colletotrichum abscissum]
MVKTDEKLKVGVIGPAGFGGSYLVVELINRGHRVVGLSRNPQKLGTHELYEPRPINLETSTEGELAEAISDLAVVVCEYGPHTAGHEALQYMPFIEMIRKIILAVKRAKTGYFVMVGGTGSLHVPHEDGVCVADSKDFFLAYRRGIADSHAHVTYMEERLGPIGQALRLYRDARLLLKEDRGSTDEKEAARETINAYEAQLKAQQDASSSFIKAARASLMFFEGNTSFDWTYVSPSALYRPGRRTGRYEITISNLPLKDGPDGDSPLDGKLLGISAADLAIAISDEIESRKHKQQHWTATGDLTDDTPAPSYLTLN